MLRRLPVMLHSWGRVYPPKKRAPRRIFAEAPPRGASLEAARRGRARATTRTRRGAREVGGACPHGGAFGF